jgi:hypothetical protein
VLSRATLSLRGNGHAETSELDDAAQLQVRQCSVSRRVAMILIVLVAHAEHSEVRTGYSAVVLFPECFGNDGISSSHDERF